MQRWGHGRWAMPLVAFVLLCQLCQPALAQSSDIRLETDVGYGGLLVPGVWMPLRVDITAPTALDGVLVIDVPDARGGTATYRYPLHLLPNIRQEFRAEVVVPDPRHPLVVRVLRDGHEVRRQDAFVGGPRTVDGIIITLTHEAAGLEFVTTFGGRVRPAYIREEDLPMRWQGYEGAAAVVIRDLEDTRLLAGQQQALRDWVAQGGRLVVTGSELLITAKGSWLEPLLPALPVGVADVRSSSLFSDISTPLTIAVVRPRPGASVQTDRTYPLVVRWHYGRGQVTLWAFDGFAVSVRGSPRLRAMWREVLTESQPASVASKTLAENLPASQSLPGVVQAQITLLLGLYIVTLRWALHRFGPARRGWLGIVAVVVISGALLYGSAVAARGAATSIVQISLVEAIPDVGLARMTTYAALVSPYGGSFRLTAPPAASIRPLGRAALNVVGAPVEIAGQAPPEGIRFELLQILPFAVRGTTALTAEGLHVEIENQSGLRIREPSIYLDGQTYRLTEIQTHLSTVLDPTKWEPADRPRIGSDELERRVQQWTFGRLGPDVIIRRDRPSLVGWVDDARLVARLQQAQSGTAVHLLVVPLDSR